MKMFVKPQWRNHGGSWGLEYPIIFGHLLGIGWAAWDRHTGEIKLVSKIENRILAEAEVSKFSQPTNYRQNPFVNDAIP